MPRGDFDRSERRAHTRARLLEAAAKVYARSGFDGATLDEVAADAGLTKGAVYNHFGSKEKLLLALLEEHLSAQVAEQVALFDSSRATDERPRAGADRWMADLEADPAAFRLFIEAWVHAQRDRDLRGPVLDGIDAWRATLTSFGRQRAAEREADVPDALLEQIATVMLALGIGLGMIRLADPDSVPQRLLGAVYVLLLGALENSDEARELLARVAPVPQSPAAQSPAAPAPAAPAPAPAPARA